MGYPNGNSFITILDRTVDNMEFLENQKSQIKTDSNVDPDLYEVTQRLNSMLAVLVMPWDQVFEESALRSIASGSTDLFRCGLEMVASSDATDIGGANIWEMFQYLRNGLSHGLISWLSRDDLVKRAPHKAVPSVATQEIAAVEIISNQPPSYSVRKWGCILTVDEMKALIESIQKMSRNQSMVKKSVWNEHLGAFPNHGKASKP